MNGTNHKLVIYENDQGFFRIKFDTWHSERWLLDSDMMQIMLNSHVSQVQTFKTRKAAERMIKEYYSYWNQRERDHKLSQSLTDAPVYRDTWKKSNA